MECDARSNGREFDSVIVMFIGTAALVLVQYLISLPPASIPESHTVSSKYFQPVGFFIYRNSHIPSSQMARRYMALSQTPKCFTFE